MNNGFKKLLESVKERFPDLITEEAYNDMLTEFDTNLAKMTEDATKDGQAIGFREGYEEGKRVAAEQAKAEYDKLLEKLDEEAVQKLTSIIEMIDEDHTNKLQELYDYFKTTTVPREELQRALDEQDEDYANKLDTAYEAICNDHAKKLEEVVDVIDADHAEKFETAMQAMDKNYAAKLEETVNLIDEEHTKKLQEIATLFKEDKEKVIKTITESINEEHSKKIEELTNLYESKLTEANKALEEEKSRKLDILAENVEKYLNYALEANIPKKELISEQKYKAMANTIDKVTDILKVNAIIQESKDEIFKDYEKQIAEAKEETNKLLNEKIELANELNKKEAQLVLESKVQRCPPAEARFLREYFKNANSPKIIEESIEEARASFKRIQAEKRSALQVEVKKTTTSIPSNVVTESSKKEEKKESDKKIISAENHTESVVDMYAKYLTKK